MRISSKNTGCAMTNDVEVLLLQVVSAVVGLLTPIRLKKAINSIWYRETSSGALREVRTGEGGGRYAVAGVGDAGLTGDALSVVNSGGTANMSCSWGGWPSPRLEWLHNGAPVSSGVSGGRVQVQSGGGQLVIAAVTRADRGVYQCMARNERDSAQASAELRLGVLRPGQVVTLKCSAAGSPPPHFSWLLDGQPLNTMARGHRYSVEQFAAKNNEVVSYLNISSVRADDGGLYTWPPYVRSIGPIRAVAGRELSLYCPYSGYPISVSGEYPVCSSSVKWERDGSQVEWGGGISGALRVARVEAAHGGAYTCTEGKRAQVSCSVISGDMPVHFLWLKDNGPIPSSLQVEERAADFFSNLVFKEVSARHSGSYTCVASNSAAKVNYTAELVVKGNHETTHQLASHQLHQIAPCHIRTFTLKHQINIDLKKNYLWI
ncbi:unnamed protein product [Leptidea sinapis]|uniref:Hemolin n=1 Tax=Leptidea sinapis TaxID=189913 RepID=A0A5E4QC33_9NEOP|nr:unnamed protein product [Leptidea sinapis]